MESTAAAARASQSESPWCWRGACCAQAAPPERARTLEYDEKQSEWLEVAPPPPGTPEGDLRLAKVALGEERFRKALKLSRQVVKRYGEDVEVYPEALIVQAEALIGLHEYHDAHLILDEFLNMFRGFEAVVDALRLEFVIAETYLSGTKRKLWGLRIFSGVDIAFRVLDEISAGYEDTELSALALKTKADYQYRKGEYALAELDYAQLVRYHPDSRYHQIALRRTAESALASFAGVDYDEAALIEAAERFRDYARQYPGAAAREQVDATLDGIAARRAQKELRIGAYYERTDHLASAVFYYESVATQWPDTAAAAEAQRRLQLLSPSTVSHVQPTGTGEQEGVEP